LAAPSTAASTASRRKVTRLAETLVIEPGDARHILLAAPEGDLIFFMCADADGSGAVVFGDEDGEVHSVEITTVRH
jgi:hypothetical protein